MAAVTGTISGVNNGIGNALDKNTTKLVDTMDEEGLTAGQMTENIMNASAKLNAVEAVKGQIGTGYKNLGRTGA